MIATVKYKGLAFSYSLREY